MQVAMMPQSNKSPFAIFNEPTSDEILVSLDNDCIVIFCDGSTYTNPDPSMSNWLELEYPITCIKTNIGSETEAMRLALEYVGNHYRFHFGRLIILTDCKFVINAIFNKWDFDIYKLPIMDCQKISKLFNEDNVPEIYWIKGHSGITGNDKVDLVANNARKKAQQLQPDLI
ncbi:RnhA2 [Reticulomyxa filosa]|uniref:RnhA2 n=1 Tax=Reticulomyxa filosa TaxID=46433 RepID=X6LGX1_RETFI|nr:RnhA2 [Reticulomyxa filosa]|eukprot:ETO00626.1 RnhA2 [Reticulomyxa filosa]